MAEWESICAKSINDHLTWLTRRPHCRDCGGELKDGYAMLDFPELTLTPVEICQTCNKATLKSEKPSPIA